jgi:farnesyl diphosphate synthase
VSTSADSGRTAAESPVNAAIDAEARIQALAAEAESALDRRLPPESSEPRRLHQAMRYAVTGGGKRIRPVLTYASGQALGMAPAQLHGLACAVEMIHAYSLIHDDLPAMDNDDLRRGRPTCHKAFDEATAILAGDALQAMAFEVLIESLEPARRRRVGSELVLTLARAAGHTGMAGGQAVDLAAVDNRLSLAELEHMHRLKTGALIEAAVTLPALAGENTGTEQIEALRAYARHIGLAFQIQDDILDAIGDTQVLGKNRGADQALNKPTYYNLLGLDGARRHLQQTHQAAIDALAPLDTRADLLRAIADYIVQRTH